MQHYDKEAIYDRLSGREVAEMLGLPINRKGNVICPSPNHDDRHLGNCCLTPKGCRCFACDETFGLVDMVMNVRGVKYVDALKELSDYAGLTENNSSSKEKISYVKMPLSTEEFELLGIKKSYAALKPSKYLESKPSDFKKYTRDKSGGYIIQEVGWKNPVLDMYQNDPDTFWQIIEEKAKEKLASIVSALEIPGLTEGFRQALLNIKQQILGILTRRSEIEVAA